MSSALTSSPQPAVQMCGITKRFGTLVANDAVDFTLCRGQIHALLGENGAGKTTLMRVLYGFYRPEAGSIAVNGHTVSLTSPRDAIAQGIGMVTQHFALALPLTVTENVVLGAERGVQLDLPAAQRRVQAAALRFGIDLDPAARVKDLSIGQRQRVEILKALYRNATVLILDEPTAVLLPQEAEYLFATLRGLQNQGLSVVFISHKLHEVMAITDQVTVMRNGRAVNTVETAHTTQAELARFMVGRTLTPPPARPAPPAGQPVTLRLEQVSALDNKGLPALKKVSLTLHAGEILGLAGVSGNGQVELAEVLAGTRPVTGGRVLVDDHDIANADPLRVMQAGVGRIPEDRHASVVGEMTVAQNMALEHLNEFTAHGLLDKGRITRHAEQLIAAYQIKARPDDRIRTLSGGNMQKVILARVLERNPRVLVAAQPTRGLDVGAGEYVHGKLLEQRTRQAAVLLISEDLDEILALADRIAVIYEGEIRGVLPRAEADSQRLGLLMSGASA